MRDFEPPVGLRSPHVQTVLSSRIARSLDRSGAARAVPEAERVTLDAGRGVRLQALVNGAGDAPLVVVIHGWFGKGDSPYVLRTTAALLRSGFRVARLLLRDHGGTAGLNAEMFHSARIREVVAATRRLAEGRAATGIMGFSLGGNFALRVASLLGTGEVGACLAVCPLIDPVSAVRSIDTGWVGYRGYFLGKWKRALAEKQAAFPDRYDFREALPLRSVAALTDYFVKHHSPYRDADDYYARYAITDETLGRIEMPAEIVAAADDPVLPAADLQRLGTSHGVAVTVARRGGHCAFLRDLRMNSALPGYAVDFFARHLRRGAKPDG